MKEAIIKTREQIDVLSECIDLRRNGYFVRLQVFNETFWYVKLRHFTNGNEIILKWMPSEWTITKNGRVVKRVAF